MARPRQARRATDTRAIVELALARRLDGSMLSGAYFPPGRAPENLNIRSESSVAEVAFDGTRAREVVLLDGELIEAGWVVLSAGTYGIPSILMRSGVGGPSIFARSGFRFGSTRRGSAPTLPITRESISIAATAKVLARDRRCTSSPHSTAP
jgi:choline dehydrogenase-like flavoprotein